MTNAIQQNEFSHRLVRYFAKALYFINGDRKIGGTVNQKQRFPEVMYRVLYVQSFPVLFQIIE